MKIHLLFVLFLAVTVSSIIARPHRVGQIPNGFVNGCANCHMSAAGGDARNDFGQVVESSFLTVRGPEGNVLWGPALASLDSDGDGVSNGAELQDPEGVWQPGQPNPGNSSLVTLPGNSSDFPTDVNDENGLPETYSLAQNYPNPFNPNTQINFQIPESGIVMIKVHNSLGQEVTTLLDEFKQAGFYSVDFKADGLKSGVYYYQLVTSNAIITRKMLLLK